MSEDLLFKFGAHIELLCVNFHDLVDISRVVLKVDLDNAIDLEDKAVLIDQVGKHFRALALFVEESVGLPIVKELLEQSSD